MNYKRTYTILSLFCYAFASGQSFEVINCRGFVKSLKTYDQLVRGSQYQKEDSLFIESDSCRLAIIDEHNKVYIMESQKINGTYIPRYTPVPYKIQGRPGKITSSISLIHHLNEDDNYLVTNEEIRVAISPQFFEMNQNSFFYIRYYWNNDTINKKLPSINNHFVINKEDLFQALFFEDERYGKDTLISIDAEEVDRFEFRCHVDDPGRVFFDPSYPDEQQRREFIPLKLKFIDQQELKTELEFLVPSLRNLNPDISEDELFGRTHSFIQKRFKGKVEITDFEKWVRMTYCSLSSI